MENKSKNKKSVYKEIIDWLQTHDGNLPNYARYPKYLVYKNDEILTLQKMPREERMENDLYQRWHESKEKAILDEYIGRPIEEVPKAYRRKIERLRRYGLGLEKQKEPSKDERALLRGEIRTQILYDELMEWLKNHNGKMPRRFRKRSKKTQIEEFTLEEKYEGNLHERWNCSKLKQIYYKYLEVPIENIPEEYREKIKNLRNYKVGFRKLESSTVKVERKENMVSEKLIEWLEMHNGKMPKGQVRRNGFVLSIEEMTEEEKKQTRLYSAWIKSEERQILYKYAGKDIEEVPENYRKNIAILRKYNLDSNIKTNKKTVFEELIEWLETHDGRMPRGYITFRDGKRILTSELTKEEKYERNLYKKWYLSKEGKSLLQYLESPIEEVPEEYKEKVIILKKYKQAYIKRNATDTMRESVGKQVKNNANTRAELENITRQVEYDENNANAREKLANIIRQIEPEER